MSRFVALACIIACALACPFVASAQAAPKNTDQPSAKQPDKFDWLVLNTDVGFRSLRITRIDFDDGEEVPKFLPATAYGVAPGMSLGVRLWFVSLMARSEVAFFNGSESNATDQAFRLWSIDGQLAFRAPIGRVQPYLLLGAGYSAMGGLSGTAESSGRTAQARGANARGGLGLDWFVGDIWTVGALVSIDGLFLSSRAPVKRLAAPEQVDTVGQARDRARDADGALFGYSPSVALNVGLRI